MWHTALYVAILTFTGVNNPIVKLPKKNINEQNSVSEQSVFNVPLNIQEITSQAISANNVLF